jgi:hypothetical protein
MPSSIAVFAEVYQAAPAAVRNLYRRSLHRNQSRHLPHPQGTTTRLSRYEEL